MIDIKLLNSISVAAYQEMTFPSFQRALGIIGHDGPMIAVGASHDGRPVGLGFGQLAPGRKGVPPVLSLSVKSAFRNQGIGTSLLSRLEIEMRRCGCRELRISYLDKKSRSASLERVLAKCGWPVAEPHKLFAEFTIAKMLTAQFMIDYELPPSFEMFRWEDITKQQRAALQVECESGGWVPPSLAPFQYEANLEPRNSLGLRREGQVVGWQLTQQLQPETLTYSCSYMHPQWQTRGRIFKMYVESVRLQARHAPEYPRASLVVPYEFGPMAKFVQRRFQPYLASTSVFKAAVKNFESGS
jgi:GNAT superfamily N-acetyltransferase